MIYQVYCFDCEQKYEQVSCRKPGCCGVCASERVGVLEEDPPADLGNRLARSGYDRCTCGCKYFEKDRCIDCGRHVSETPVCPAVGCGERNGGRPCWEHEHEGAAR